jgi:hypothetical protein
MVMGCKVTCDVPHKMLVGLFLLITFHELLNLDEFRKRIYCLGFDVQLKKASIVKPKERMVWKVTMHYNLCQGMILTADH